MAATVTALSFGLFAGCSTGSDKTAAPTSTTAPTATTRQVASIVAQHRPAILEAIPRASDCETVALTAATDSAFKDFPGDPGVDRAFEPLLNCQGAVNFGLSKDAGAIANGLAAIHPPAEVRALTTQTEAAARTVANEARQIGGCLPNGTAMLGTTPARYAADDKVFNCLIDVDSFTAEVAALRSALGGWDAYLG